MYKKITLLLCFLMILGFMMSGCHEPYSVDETDRELHTTQDNENGGTTVIYSETFENSVILEFLEDNEGAVSVSLTGNIDKAQDFVGRDSSAIFYYTSACDIYKAVKQSSSRGDTSISVPDVLVELDEKLNNHPAIEGNIEGNFEKIDEIGGDEIDSMKSITKGIEGISRHGTTDDNIFLNKLATLPGSMEAKYLSYYYVTLAKNAYHLFFLSFNSSSSLDATYQHWIYSLGIWKDSIVRTVRPRYFYFHYYLRTISKVYRKSKLTAGDSAAQNSIYFALKWDSTPVAHASDTYFYYPVNDRLVFVDFFATWCGPCGIFGPVFEDVASQITSHMFIKVDIDKCPNVTNDYNVSYVPYILALLDGTVVEQYSGDFNSTAYKSWCEDVIDDYD